MLHTPDDARLLIGLAGRSDAWQGNRFTGRRRVFVGIAFVAALVVAVAAHDGRDVVQLAVTGSGLVVLHRFLITPLRKRRHAAVIANRHAPAGSSTPAGTNSSL